MKFGQALSACSRRRCPRRWPAPYREQLTKLQDSAPPMPTQTVRDQLARATSAPDWRDQLVWLDGGPTAAASIGQVHKGRWHDGRDVAVKVQYPGAGEALMSDLRQLARVARGIAPGLPRHRHQAAGRGAAGPGRRGARLPARGRGAARRSPRRSATTPTSSSPTSSPSASSVLVTEWLESPALAGHVIREGTQEERDHYGELFVRFLFAGPAPHRHAARRPAPRQLPDAARPRTARPAGSGVLDFGAVARLPERGLPEAMGRLIRIAADDDAEALVDGLREEGFIKDRIQIDPQLLLDYLAPFVEPTQVERFRFTREWMRDAVRADQQPARARRTRSRSSSTCRRRTC